MAANVVHKGFWVDHSTSPILGATVTLSIEWANLLVSTLTVAVTISAAAFWKIMSFLMYEWMIDHDRTDLVGLQHQVLLRNSDAPLSTLWELILVLSAWKSTKVRRIRLRTLRLALPALVIWVSFTIASIFVSTVASKTYSEIRVLVQSKNCGVVFSDSSSLSGVAAYIATVGQNNKNARTYAEAWYANSSAFVSAATIYPVNALSYNTTNGTSCPFGELCMLGANSGFTVATPLLDSHADFGVNSPPKDRVHFQ
jgi:hypothetical protein